MGSVEAGKSYDACELIKSSSESLLLPILIDQGDCDNFYIEKQLLPENLVKVAATKKVQIALRLQQGYDHSYYFISTFIKDHVEHHAKYLCS